MALLNNSAFADRISVLAAAVENIIEGGI
jgi:hypothetical protein